MEELYDFIDPRDQIICDEMEMAYSPLSPINVSWEGDYDEVDTYTGDED